MEYISIITKEVLFFFPLKSLLVYEVLMVTIRTKWVYANGVGNTVQNREFQKTIPSETFVDDLRLSVEKGRTPGFAYREGQGTTVFRPEARWGNLLSSGFLQTQP